MNKLLIEGTRKTPTVLFDPTGNFRIEGRSIPEDARTFYEPIIHWVEKYISSPASQTTCTIAFEYLNSGTSKYILEILTLLKGLQQHGKKLSINWHYEEGDDDILERGEYYASILDIKINFVETE